MNAIAAENLAVHLGGAPIVRGVSLHVAEGECVSIIGPNGAGKSTLLRAVGGLLPAEGSVALFGTGVARLKSRQREQLVAMVPQSPVVPPGIRVIEYILLGRTPYIAPLGRESHHDLDVVLVRGGRRTHDCNCRRIAEAAGDLHGAGLGGI